MLLTSYYCVFTPARGARPHISSYINTPNAQTSVLGLYFFYLIAYGVMYIGLPRQMSVKVDFYFLANPKSAILHTPY